MLAFGGLERDEGGAFTEDTELGADLHVQVQDAIINIDRMLTAFFTGVASTAGKKP